MKKTWLLLPVTIVIVVLLLVPITGCKKKTPQKYPGQLKPGSAAFYLNEGIFYLNSGNLAMAEKKLLLALKKNPTMLQAINGLGIIYLNKRDFQKATKYFRQVIRTNPEAYDAYNYLGVIYTELNEYNLAKENLLVAANASKYKTPENAFANLAMLELKQKKYKAALRYVNKGMIKNERFAPLSNLKGVILENQKNYRDALLWYKRALSLLTEPDVTYLINIGRVYSKQGKKEQALDILEKALSKAFTPQLKTQIHKMINELEK